MNGETDRQELRNKVSIALWEKQFENTIWASKIHLIAPRSLEPYREFADKLIDIILRNTTRGMLDGKTKD